MGSEVSADPKSPRGRKSPLRVVRIQPTLGGSAPSSPGSSEERVLTPIEELPPLSPSATMPYDARIFESPPPSPRPRHTKLPPPSPRPQHAKLPTQNSAFSSNYLDRSPDPVDTDTPDTETEIDIHISHEELMSRRNSVMVNRENNEDSNGIPGDVTFWTTLSIIRRKQAATGKLRPPAPPSAPRKSMPRPTTFILYRFNSRGYLIRPLEENTFEQDRPRSQSQLRRERQPQQVSFVVDTDIGSSFAGFSDRPTVSVTEVEDEDETEAAAQQDENMSARDYRIPSTFAGFGDRSTVSATEVEVEDETEAAAQQDENMSTRGYRTPSTSLGVDAQPDSTTARGYLSLPFLDREYESDEEDEEDESNEEEGSKHVENVQPPAPKSPLRSAPQFQLHPPPYPAPPRPRNRRRESVHGDAGQPSEADIIEEPEPMDWELTPPATPTVDLSSRFREAFVESRGGPPNLGSPSQRRWSREYSEEQEDISMPDARQNEGSSRVS